MHEANALTKRIVKYVTSVTFLSVVFTATRQVLNHASREYRVAHRVSDLGWVDFDLDIPLIFPNCYAHSAYLSSAQSETGKQWKQNLGFEVNGRLGTT